MKTGLRSDPAEWTDERHKRGLAGEQQAIQYLLSRGWHIVAHRFRVGHTEIDVIVRQGSLVAFIEVKARRGDTFRSPFEADDQVDFRVADPKPGIGRAHV